MFRLKPYIFSFLVLLLLPRGALGSQTNGPFPGAEDFLEGLRLQERKNFSDSIGQFRAATVAGSLVADYSLYRMAQSALYMDDKDLAASTLEKLINDFPDSPIRPSAQVEIGTLYYETRRFSKATPFIQAAISNASSSSERDGLTLLLAKSHFEMGNKEQSESICWQLVHNRPATPEALEAVSLLQHIDTPQKELAVGKVYVLNKKSDEALVILDNLMNQAGAASLLPEALLYRAQALALQGHKEEAADVYQRIIVEFPDDGAARTALFNHGEYNRTIGALDGALADYEKLVQQFPASALAPQALLQRSKVFALLHDPREYKEYERILQEYPKSSPIFPVSMKWGIYLYQAGDYERASKIFQRLLNANYSSESNQEALFWMGKSSLAKGEVAAARSLFQTLVAKHKDSYHSFRAQSILRSLDMSAEMYSQPYSSAWDSLFLVERNSAQPQSAPRTNNVSELLDALLSGLGHDQLERLRFLVLNELPEAKLEIDFLALKVQGGDAHYALAWALYQLKEYYDSLRIASSLREPLADSERSDQLPYLLYPAAYPDLLEEKSSKYGVDPLLALAVMREESHFMKDCVSSSDACGLMQILPKTGKWLAVQMLAFSNFEREDLFLPSVNIELGNFYLRYLLLKFDNNPLLAVAAYNWGETNLRNWLPSAPKDDYDLFVESIPADETRRYVKKVFKSYAIYQSLYSREWFSQKETSS